MKYRGGGHKLNKGKMFNIWLYVVAFVLFLFSLIINLKI